MANRVVRTTIKALGDNEVHLCSIATASETTNMYFLVILGLVGAAAAAPQAILPLHSWDEKFIIPSLDHGHDYHKFIVPTTMIDGRWDWATGKSLIMDPHKLKSDWVVAKSWDGLPKPVEDTPEVKRAKLDFAVAYNRALLGHHDLTTVVRAKRDISHLMPWSSHMSYMMPTTHHLMPGHLSYSPFLMHHH